MRDKELELCAALGNRLNNAGVLVDGVGCRVGRVSFTDYVDGWEAVQWCADFLGIGAGFFGVESVSCEGTDAGELSYMNAGDTYDLTVCRVDDGEFFVGSWGDWYESAEAEHTADSGEVRCGYCSAMTEAGDDWSAARCESCGRNVSTGERMPEPCDDDD